MEGAESYVADPTKGIGCVEDLLPHRSPGGPRTVHGAPVHAVDTRRIGIGQPIGCFTTWVTPCQASRASRR